MAMTAVTLPANLPSIARAKLPAVYEGARAALEKCDRIDECKDWSDKAAAMASYAKQSQDESLFQMATRIKARATRRCGELLQAIDRAEQGGRPKKNGGHTPPVSREQAAKDSGLSRDQKRTALRVANVPAPLFECAVESESPPTVTELAKLGTKSKPVSDYLAGRDPKDFQATTTAMGWLRRMVEVADEAPVAAVLRGANERERALLLKTARQALPWLERLVAGLEDTE